MWSSNNDSAVADLHFYLNLDLSFCFFSLFIGTLGIIIRLKLYRSQDAPIVDNYIFLCYLASYLNIFSSIANDLSPRIPKGTYSVNNLCKPILVLLNFSRFWSLIVIKYK